MLFRVLVAAALLVALVAPSTVAPAPAPAWQPLVAQAEAAPTERWTPQDWAARDDPPTPGLQGGIGPGSALQQSTGSSGYICTAAFLLRDPFTGTYYLSTAGHCLVKDDEATGPLTGEHDADKLHTTFSICVASCISNALGLGTYVDLVAQAGDHPVAYARSNGVGEDFGILRIPAELHDQLRPELPLWHGPTGVAGSLGASEPVVLYGHGSLCCPQTGALVTRTPADQGRSGTGLSADKKSWEAVGWTSGGDSGSGVAIGVVSADTLTGGDALGVLTHGTYVAHPVASLPLFTGTLLEHGLAMVREHTGLQLEAVLADDPLPPGPTQEPPAPVTATVAITTPAAGATLDRTSKKVRIEGVASHGETMPAGDAVQVAIDDPAFGSASRVPIAGNATWSGTWQLDGEANGQHVIRARLVDVDGVVLAQENVTITLQKGAVTASTSASGTSAPRGTTGGSAGGTGGAGGDGALQAADAGKPAKAPLPGLVVALAALALAVVLRRRA